MLIRTAVMDDLEALAAVEAECFPPAEAATEEDLRGRLEHYGDHFWLMFDGEKLIAFVDGFVTDEPDLTDGMYETASMHFHDTSCAEPEMSVDISGRVVTFLPAAAAVRPRR